MFNWSLSMLYKIAGDDNILAGSVLLASFNMLIQILFSVMFGEKSVPRIGGKR